MSSHVALKRPQTASSSRLTLVTVISTVILATCGCAVQAQNPGPNVPPPNESYSWSLKSGLLTVGVGETVTVLIADLASSDSNALVTVRFFDRHSNLLDEIEDLVSPEQSLIAEYINNQNNQQRTPIRLEVVLRSQEIEFEPVTTVEVHRPGSFEIIHRVTCFGPPAREPVETEIVCPGLVVLPNFNP